MLTLIILYYTVKTMKIKLNIPMIKSELKKQRWTYEVFGWLIGCKSGKSAISRIFKRESTTLKRIGKMAKILKMNPEDLMK